MNDDEKADFAEFEAAFNELRRCRNLRMGRPRTTMRDDLIFRAVKWATKAGLGRWHDDSKVAKGKPKRTAFSVAADALGRLYGVRMSPNALRVAYYRQRQRLGMRHTPEHRLIDAETRRRTDAIKASFEPW